MCPAPVGGVPDSAPSRSSASVSSSSRSAVRLACSSSQLASPQRGLLRGLVDIRHHRVNGEGKTFVAHSTPLLAAVPQVAAHGRRHGWQPLAMRPLREVQAPRQERGQNVRAREYAWPHDWLAARRLACRIDAAYHRGCRWCVVGATRSTCPPRRRAPGGRWSGHSAKRQPLVLASQQTRPPPG
jgi:hypothetical protein